jgi:hypothetical protein
LRTEIGLIENGLKGLAKGLTGFGSNDVCGLGDMSSVPKEVCLSNIFALSIAGETSKLA